MTFRILSAIGCALVAATLAPVAASAMIVMQPALATLASHSAGAAAGHVARQDGSLRFRPCPPGFHLTATGICVPQLNRPL